MTNIASNLYKLYWLKISKWFLLVMPIIVPFYQNNGLDVQQVMTIQSIFSIAVVLMEVPSGYLGDVLGRKKSLVIGSILIFVGYLFYSLTSSFVGFLLAAITLGIGTSFISGSDSALLYDTLQQLNRTTDYMRLEGKYYAIGNFAEAIAGITGGLLAAHFTLAFPFYCQTAISAIGIFAAMTLIEPERAKVFSANTNWQNIKQTIHYAFIANRELRWILIYASVMAGATITIAWFAQPYFLFAEVPLIYFGILWTALNVTVGIASWFAHKLENYFRAFGLMLGVCVLIVGGYLGAAFSPAMVGIVFLFVVYIGRGIATPTFNNFINSHTTSDMRATVLSLRSFMFRLIFAVLAPFMGWITDVYTVQEALMVAGVIFMVVSVVSLAVIWRMNKHEIDTTKKG
ncbi:MAG: MFS transporter [Chitinophagales bacterium]